MSMSLAVNTLAFADSQTYYITVPNTAISGDTGPYGSVQVDLTSATTATITFNALTNGGYIYLIGGNSAFDLNVNASSFSKSTPPVFTNLTGFSPSFDSYGSGNVSSFGTFNLVGKLSGGFTSTATSVSFVLTNNSGIWTSASNVLINNSSGYALGMHAFPCQSPGCTTSTGAAATGYAAGSLIVPAPEPGTWLLLGTALLGILGWQSAKKRRVKNNFK